MFVGNVVRQRMRLAAVTTRVVAAGQFVWRSLSVLGCGLLFSIGMASPAAAQWIELEDLAGPYIDGEPFDLLFFNADGENAILKILPPKDPPPEPFPTRGVLIFEYADETGEVLQVPWSVIETYKTFNDLLLEEANAWLQTKEYGRAFRNLLYIYDHGGKKNPALRCHLEKLPVSRR